MHRHFIVKIALFEDICNKCIISKYIGFWRKYRLLWSMKSFKQLQLYHLSFCINKSKQQFIIGVTEILPIVWDNVDSLKLSFFMKLSFHALPFRNFLLFKKQYFCFCRSYCPLFHIKGPTSFKKRQPQEGLRKLNLDYKIQVIVLKSMSTRIVLVT